MKRMWIILLALSLASGLVGGCDALPTENDGSWAELNVSMSDGSSVTTSSTSKPTSIADTTTALTASTTKAPTTTTTTVTIIVPTTTTTTITTTRATTTTTTTQRTTTTTATQAAAEPQGEMVWVSKTGKRYHCNASCSGMKNPSQVSLSVARSRGLTPCKNCY